MYVSSKHQAKQTHKQHHFLRHIYEISCESNVQWPNLSKGWLHAGCWRIWVQFQQGQQLLSPLSLPDCFWGTHSLNEMNTCGFLPWSKADGV